MIKQILLASFGAGIAGTIANALVAGLWLGSDKFALVLVPGRYVVAIACACLAAAIFNLSLAPLWRSGALAVLVVLPSLIAKLVFGATAPWAAVLLLNGVYAIAAWTVLWGMLARLASPLDQPRDR